MGTVKCHIKTGMGGSRCGKSRTEGTEILKKSSKKARRQNDNKIINEQEQSHE